MAHKQPEGNANKCFCGTLFNLMDLCSFSLFVIAHTTFYSSDDLNALDIFLNRNRKVRPVPVFSFPLVPALCDRVNNAATNSHLMRISSQITYTGWKKATSSARRLTLYSLPCGDHSELFKFWCFPRTHFWSKSRLASHYACETRQCFHILLWCHSCFSLCSVFKHKKLPEWVLWCLKHDFLIRLHVSS